MKSKATLSIEDTNLIIEMIANRITRRLVSFEGRLDEAVVRHLTNATLAGRDTEQLLGRVAAQIKTLVAGKVGGDLAQIARLSRHAFASPDGLRRWIGDAHKAARIAFLEIASDYRSGQATEFDLFLAQITLAGIAEARGLLGIPIEAKDRVAARNIRQFEPADFPDRDVRHAIVEAVFNRDNASIARLWTAAATVEHDADGQVTLVLACLESHDEFMRAHAAALAGKIIASDRKPITVSKLTKGEILAQLLRTPLDQQIAANGPLN